MKRIPPITGVTVLAVLLSSCTPTVTLPPTDEGDTVSSSSSASSARYATVEGVLQKSGIGMYMQGTHRLQMDDGTFLLLQSTAGVNLDAYIDERVIVTGTVEPTVEAGGTIMNVEMVERATASLQPEVLEESESSEAMAAAVSSRASPTAMAPSSPASSPAPVRSSPPAAVSSPRPVAVASSASAAPASSPAAPQTDYSVTVKAMAKAQVDSANFNQRYCSSHIGFCVPYHRNWYFQSFGATVAPYLWHVEFADHSVDEVGQGAIVVNLVSGAFDGAAGVATEQGDFVVASAQWTGNRHFEVSGPAELRSAVEFMARGIAVYQPE